MSEEPEEFERDAAHEADYEGPAAAPVPIDPAVWGPLLAEVDYQSRQWWILDSATGDWKLLPPFQVDDVLFSHGIGAEPRYEFDDLTKHFTGRRVLDPAREFVKKLLWKRDREAAKRIHDPEKRKKAEAKVDRHREREERREAAAARKRWREQRREPKKRPPASQLGLGL